MLEHKVWVCSSMIVSITTYAADEGREEVVKIPLEGEEFKPDEPNNDGRTPLSHAARYGSLGVVRILLGQEEVKPDEPDNDSRTQLSHTAESRQPKVVKILLGKG